MNIFQFCDCFYFNQHFFLDDKICSSRTNWVNDVFIKNVLLNFSREGESSLFKFICERLLINYFPKSIPKKFMNFKRGPNYLTGNIFEF